MFTIKSKTIKSFVLMACLLVGPGFVFAQTIKTENKSLIESIPGLRQIEAYRNKNYNQCNQQFIKYSKSVEGKDLNIIIDTTKRDLAYEATQKALPEDLRKLEQEAGKNYEDPKNFVKQHINGLCAKAFGSKLIYYGLIVLCLLIILKAFFKK